MKELDKFCEVSVKYSTKVRPSDRQKIMKSADCFKILKPFYEQLGSIEHREVFSIILLDRGKKVLGIVKVAEGSATACLVDIQYILRCAILTNSQALILCHNHPSGETIPSEVDKKITIKIAEATKLLEISVVDHLIIGVEENYYSFADEGLI